MTAITFSRQNDAGSRVSNTQYRENLVLVVLLVLESKLSIKSDSCGFISHFQGASETRPLCIIGDIIERAFLVAITKLRSKLGEIRP